MGLSTTLYAKWTANSYTITFDSNGGSAITAITQDFDTTVTAPTAPTKAGNTFGGWYSDAALNTAYTFTTMPAANITLFAKWTALPNHTVTFDSNSGSGSDAIRRWTVTTTLAAPIASPHRLHLRGWYSTRVSRHGHLHNALPASQNITLYAKWTANSYTITFNSNGGSAVGAITQPFGSAVSAPTAPTKTGNTFGGWYSDAGLTTPTPSTMMPAADITLYAKWTANSYTITFNSNGGSAVAAITQPFGSAVSAPTAPTKTGYTFGGWYSDAGLNTAYTFTTMPAADITLYAKWTANSYTITFNSNGGSVVTAITQDFDTAVTAPTAPTKTGNTFGGWYSDAGLNTAYTFTTMPAADITLYAKWTANSYTITFDSNGGSVVTAITQDFDTAVAAPTAPTKAGNTFGGWYSDAGLNTAYTFTTMPAANITLYAKWTALPNHTVTFDSNSGTGTMTPQVANVPTALTLNTFTRTGYTFVGWNTLANGTGANYTDGAIYSFAADITLYAKWTNLPTHSVTFNANGGTGTMTPQVANVPTALTLNTFTRTGYTFAGWNTLANGTGTNYADGAIYSFAADITLYAKWTVNSYTITFNSNGGTAVTAITQDFDTAVTAPTAPTKTGYTFGSWYSDAGLTTAYTFTTMPAADITLYAKWTANSYTITFNSNGGSAVAAITQPFGSAVSAPTAPTKAGYTFGGWYSDAGLNTAYTFTTMPASDITLYAKWTALPNHTVTFNSNSGTGTMAPQVANVPTALTLNTFTRTGYTFAGWNTLANGTGANYTDGAIYSFAADITLYAKWTVNSYTITFNSNGGSAVAAITQPFGSAVSAPTAPTKTGNTFGGWYSDAGLNTAYTFTTMPAANITLYAKWTANSYTITFNSNGGSAVAAITQPFGSAVSAPTAPTKTGNTFGGWYSDAGLNTAYTFTTMPAANITLYAKWTALPNHTVTFNSNGGTGTMAPQVANVPTALTLNTFTRTGYTFAGWNTLANGTGANYTDGAIYSFAADITLYAKWTNLPPTCYALTLSHTGQGTDPVATPANSTGCAAGQYLTAASISLSGAVPTSGWQISTWTGTNNDTSTANTNTITMPAQAHSASVNYTLIKVTPTLSVTNSPVTFNGTPQAATVTGSVAGTVSNIKYNGSATVPTNAGTYTVTANFVPNDTAAYISLTNAAAGSFSINKATPTLAVMNSPVVFNATPQAAIVTGSVTGVVSNIKYNGSASVPTAIGTYAITADFVAGDSANYNSLTNAAAGDFVIKNGSGGLGSGGDTTGVFRPSNGLLYLKNANTTGFADIAINYGLGGDYPITGDWDGNGTDTIGIYRNGIFYLRNSNTIGFADLEFAFGLPGDQPVSGDWDGDGTDTIGVYRNGQFLLRNSNSAGPEDMSFYLGNPGDVGIAGDWDGDGLDTTGVFRPSNGVIFLKNTNVSGFADIAINYGLANDQPVIGDWNDDGTDTIGVYRNGSFYLRNSNTIGFADIVFALGIPGDMPISGNWDGMP
ncbi:MAG: InlB B-repeat-containing protein [Anaerolineales bacterium]|nr:InlB B-repeat-containing protein [Anaerolineales bacterium]